MNKNLLILFLLLANFSSISALTFSEKYGNYREILVEKREAKAQKRTTQAEEIRLNNHIQGAIKKRDFMDKLREKESKIRKKIKKYL
jgi:hypothetical protein